MISQADNPSEAIRLLWAGATADDPYLLAVRDRSVQRVGSLYELLAEVLGDSRRCGLVINRAAVGAELDSFLACAAQTGTVAFTIYYMAPRMNGGGSSGNGRDKPAGLGPTSVADSPDALAAALDVRLAQTPVEDPTGGVKQTRSDPVDDGIADQGRGHDAPPDDSVQDDEDEAIGSEADQNAWPAAPPAEPSEPPSEAVQSGSPPPPSSDRADTSETTGGAAASETTDGGDRFDGGALSRQRGRPMRASEQVELTDAELRALLGEESGGDDES